MRCSRCGASLTDTLEKRYRTHNTGEGARPCHDCLDDLQSYGPIADLFNEIRGYLSPGNREKFDSTDTSMKAAFALKLVEEGKALGGTVGHLEMLRSMVASGLPAETGGVEA